MEFSRSVLHDEERTKTLTAAHFPYTHSTRPYLRNNNEIT